MGMRLIFLKEDVLGRFKVIRSRKGMELVQVGIMIAVAVGLGLVFKDKTGQFVSNTFGTLLGSSFN